MNEAVQQRIVSLEKKVGKEAKSPLFAQLANYYLETNRAKEALRICDAGLAHFPFYTTGHLVKGKALIALNMQAEARREFEFVLSFLPKNETVIALLGQIPPSSEETLTITPEKPRIEKSGREISQPAAGGNIYTIPSSTQIPINQDVDQFPGISNRVTSEPLQESEPIEKVASEAPKASTFFDAITQTPAVVSTVEDPFGFGIKTPSVEKPAIPFEASPFSIFDSVTAAPVPVSEISTPLTEQFGGAEVIETTPELSTPIPAAPIEEVSFEQYAAKRRAELSGENTITLEDFFNTAASSLVQSEQPLIQIPDVQPERPIFSPLSGPQIPTPELKEEPIVSSPPVFQIPTIEDVKAEEIVTTPLIDLPETQQQAPAPFISFDMPSTPEAAPAEIKMDLPQEAAPFIPPNSSPESDQIEELTAKLQTAKRITPVIDITPVINIVEKETPPPSQQDSTPIGFVTPTLAEIYAKQGWFDDAIKAYRTLVRTKPGEKERFEKRIAELEEQKKQSGK